MKTQIKPDAGVSWAGPGLSMIAASAAAVGLGAFWRLPQFAAEHGGGTFLVLYLVCLLVVGVPLLMSGLLVGRQGGGSVVHALRRAAEQSKATRRWGWVGYPVLLCALLLLVLGAVTASGALREGWAAVQGVFAGLGLAAAQVRHAAVSASVGGGLLWLALFLVPLAVVLALGGKALRAVLWVLAPLVPVLAAVLLVCVAGVPGFAGMAGAVLSFSPLSVDAWFDALLLAVLTLPLAVAGMVVLGGARDGELGGVAPLSLAVALLTVLTAVVVLVALSVVLAMLPVPASALPGGEMPDRLFVLLPVALAAVPAGALAVPVLFALVVVAGWCTALLLGEALTAGLVAAGLRRALAGPLMVLLAWLLGGLLLVTPLAGVLPGGGGAWVVQGLLPVTLLLLAVLVGWVLKETQVRKGLAMKRFALYMAWRAAVRILLPLAMLALLVLAVPGR